LNNSSLSYLARKKFRKNKLAMFGLILICLSIFISLFGYVISPDNSSNCNEQFLELTTKKPGFKVMFLKVRKNIINDNTNFFRFLISGKTPDYTSIPINSYRFVNDEILVSRYSDFKNEPSVISKFRLADVVFPLMLNQPVINDNKGNEIFNDINNVKHVESINKLRNIIIKKNIISRTFILGTDRFGRDLASRLIIGTRVSLAVGFISVFISIILGITLGAVAGFYRKWVDSLVMWFISVVWSVPTLLLVIAITMALGKGFWQVFIAVGLTMWVEVARVVRGQVLSLREKEFVEACRALGYGTPRILFHHIIPNIMSPVIVMSAANFASAILIEAGLSFLGIGVQPPVPSWGTMIKDHYGYILVDLGYLAFIPGIAIMLMVLAFILVGNGLRDALDTKAADNVGV
jgi:ABC-type dipeptide/oligopeptide/nickel transport system permease subunit